jgi:hypothetical protein
MPLNNPSGYGPAAPGGRDPNTGAVLRDRFHQLRGNEFAMMEGTGMATRIAQEFLASRGAPITPRNLAIAQSYLSGGALDMLEQQSSTENGIANAAIAAEGGGVAGGGDTMGGVAPPPARPTADAAVTPALVTQEGDGLQYPWMLPALLAATRQADGALVGQDARAMRPGGINGEVINGVPSVQSTRALSPMDAAIEDAIIVGVNPAPTANALPAPQPQAPVAAAPQPNPYEAQVQRAQAGPAAPPRTEDAPIATESVMPDEGAGRESVKQSVTGPNGEVLYKDTGTGRYHAINSEGKRIEARTLSALRKALRGL